MSLPGGTEWLIIGIAVLILFGGKKIPEFMRGLGKGIKEFRSAKDDTHNELNDNIKDNTEEQASK